MKIDIKHIAKLTNLPLNPTEEKKYANQLSQILDYVDKLNSVDTKNVEPSSQVTGLVNVRRNDEIIPSFSQEEALSGAKEKHNGFFKVKAILENE